MLGPAPKQGPSTPFEWWFTAILAVFFGALFVAMVVVDYEPRKMMLVFLVVFWMLLLPLHEAGHAVVAFLVGWYVGQVVIGWGRPLLKFSLGRATIEIRALPLEGFVRTVPRNMDLPRLKSALIYFAGPGVELILLAILAAAIGPSTLMAASDSYPMIAAQSLSLAIIVSAFVNLFPHSVVTEAGPIANDGLGIINSFLVPASYFSELAGTTYNDKEDQWESYDPADWWKR